MTKKLRPDEIAKLFDKAAVHASRSWSPEDIGVKLYAIGEDGTESETELTNEQRDEMLAKCVPGGPHMQLDVEMLAYEQKTGERNRNAVRLRDESVIATGATGKGKPCLKDHEHYESMSVGGRILWSRGAKVADGHYAIRMRVRLTALWAIELALRDLLGAVSISWEALGPIMCTACNAPIRTKCWHYPGMRVSEMKQQDGTKRFVWDPNGTTVVEWLYSKAGILEVSLVPIGAVQNAAIDGIRAALSTAGFSDEESIALFNGDRLDQDKSTPPTPTPEGKPMSKLDAALAAHTELSADERKAFAAKLQADLDAALAADPVLHTTKDGTQIRKSDGAVALMLAKQSDAQADAASASAAQLASERAASAIAALRSEAKALLADKGMHGTLDVHAAILGAIKSISDETLRAACVQSLTAWTAGGKTAAAPGMNPETPAPSGDGLATWNAALSAFSEKHAIKDPLIATQKFLGTPEGLAAKRAYDATRAYGTPAR